MEAFRVLGVECMSTVGPLDILRLGHVVLKALRVDRVDEVVIICVTLVSIIPWR